MGGPLIVRTVRTSKHGPAHVLVRAPGRILRRLVRERELYPRAGECARHLAWTPICLLFSHRGGRMSGTTQDDYTDRYARRVRGMTTSEIRALFAVANRPEVVSLAGGSPYIAALPLDAVGEMLAKLASDLGTTSLQYGIGQGTVDLRERICDVMSRSGIDGASPDDVVVTVGGQQALDLIARLFLDPGDVVLAEGPTYVGALGVFQAAQAQVRHVAIDADGLVPAALE